MTDAVNINTGARDKLLQEVLAEGEALLISVSESSEPDSSELLLLAATLGEVERFLDGAMVGSGAQEAAVDFLGRSRASINLHKERAIEALGRVNVSSLIDNFTSLLVGDIDPEELAQRLFEHLLDADTVILATGTLRPFVEEQATLIEDSYTPLAFLVRRVPEEAALYLSALADDYIERAGIPAGSARFAFWWQAGESDPRIGALQKALEGSLAPRLPKTVSTSCLDAITLDALSRGTARANEDEEAHLRECDRCLAALNQLCAKGSTSDRIVELPIVRVPQEWMLPKRYAQMSTSVSELPSFGEGLSVGRIGELAEVRLHVLPEGPWLVVGLDLGVSLENIEARDSKGCSLLFGSVSHKTQLAAVALQSNAILVSFSVTLTLRQADGKGSTGELTFEAHLTE